MVDPVRIAIVVPQVGEAIAEATIVEWNVDVGASVKTGDILFVVDTEKAEVDIESFVDGTVAEILVEPGSAVMPGERIGAMLVDRENVPVDAEIMSDDTPDEPQPDPASNGQTPGPGSAPTTTRGASPLARKRAKELGIDIAAVVAAVGGAVSVSDVESFEAPVDQSAAAGPIQTRLQKAVAAATTDSKQTVPHFYVDTTVDMTAVLEDRRNASKPKTVTSYVVAACVRALEGNPEWNVGYGNDGLNARSNISIGVAVDTSEGLLVPILADLEGADLTRVQDELSGAVARAKQQKLIAADQGQRSLVVSNLGMFGVERFHAIINQPDPFILAVGRTEDSVVVVDGEIAVRPRAVLSVSADHRVVDGVAAAKFLASVVEHLENVDQEVTQ
jgi:pyruvate dehydrogenase E2 component (dihydrolipoamide acetyltransferase)